MKFIQRLVIGGLMFSGLALFFIINQITYSPIICKLKSDDTLDPRKLSAEELKLLATLHKGDGDALPGVDIEDPVKLLEDETSISKLSDFVKRYQEICEKEREGKTPPVWRKIVRQRHSDRFLIPFHMLADQRQLYKESPADIRVVDKLLQSLATSPIVAVAEIDGGTQIKLNLTLADGTRALFKPARFGRDVTANPNHFYFSDMERHISEIASYHLDRLLGFRRVPPCSGRVVNLNYDIKRLADRELLGFRRVPPCSGRVVNLNYDVKRLADRTLKKTFFTSPVGNTCFMSHCDYYCDSAHAICGHPEVVEGSMSVYLPDDAYAPRDAVKHPWRRSYSKHKQELWETDPTYCSNVTARPHYRHNQKRRLDLIDMAVFDFLISNLDRHHYEVFDFQSDNTFTIILDNGKGFGMPDKDEISILAPLYQCCFIRLTTLTTLLQYHEGPETLGQAMQRSLGRDPLPSVLHEGHLRALDRRLRKILTTVYDCLYHNKDNRHVNERVRKVIIDDIV